MRPLELTLEGFTSFRNKAEIDFSKLELFAITGQTGAGKSSLLDAMTLALYGKIARFVGNKTQPKELLSQGSSKLQVTFRFLADGTEYQVSRTWSYRTKTPQTIFKLDKWQNGEWEPVGEQKEQQITARVEQILGMDFETFTKVILLPQGQFDKFLKGKASERREILTKLAGYTIFDQMREKAERQANDLKAEFKALESQLAGLQVPTPVELEQKRNQYQTLEQELPRLNHALEQARKDLEEEEKLFERLKRLASRQKELAQLNEQTTEIERLRQQLERARVTDQLQGSWELVKAARNQYQKAQNATEAARKALTQAQAELKVQEEKLSEVQAYQADIEPQLKTREQALNSAKIYEDQRCQIAAEVKRAEQNLAQKAETLAKREQDVKAAEAEFKAFSDRDTQADNEVTQYSPGGVRLELLNQVAPLLTQWQFIDEQVESDRLKLEQATQQLQTADQAYWIALLNLEPAQAALRDASTALEVAEAANAAVVQQNHAAALRLLLHTGDNCPVCGGIYPEAHLLPTLPESSIVDIKPLQKRKAKAEQALQKAQTEKTKAETTLENLKQKELEYNRALGLSQATQALVQQQISALLQVDHWEVEALEKERQALQESDDNYDEALSRREKAKTDLKNSELAFKFAENSFESARSQQQNAAGEVERQKTKLQEIVAKSELPGGQSYDTLSQLLERDRKNLASRIAQANKSHQAARDKFIVAEEANTKARKDVESACTEKEQQDADWKANLQAVKFTEEIFLKAKASLEKQANWQKQIDDHSRKKVEMETLVKQDTDEIGGRTTDEQTIAQRQEAIHAANEGRKQAQDEYNQLSVWIAKAEGQWQQSERLQAELKAKQQQEQTYRTLSRDLQSDKFQAYILEHFETELVQQATVLLRELTGERYALKYENKEYWVEDYWSSGEARRVQTLSGGETFATSLSLALALSEKLSRGAKLGSLFIDEGFGTLDAETLESINQILQSLQEQDRMIGVITHVRALGEQFPQIKVEKSPEGSQIIV